MDLFKSIDDARALLKLRIEVYEDSCYESSTEYKTMKLLHRLLERPFFESICICHYGICTVQENDHDPDCPVLAIIRAVNEA